MLEFGESQLWHKCCATTTRTSRQARFLARVSQVRLVCGRVLELFPTYSRSKRKSLYLSAFYPTVLAWSHSRTADSFASSRARIWQLCVGPRASGGSVGA